MGQYNSKGALFFDLDGTVFYHGTGDPIGNSIDFIKTLHKEGYKIYFTTYRGPENWPDDSKYGKQTTLDQLDKLNVPYEDIIWDVPSPRIIINDDGVESVRVKTNEGFNLDEILDILKNCK